MSETPDSESVLDQFQRWRRGDLGALAELAPVVQAWMRQAASKALGGLPRAAADSSDLAQDIWLRLLSRLRYSPASTGQFKALVQRIARNEVVDRLRRLRTHGGEQHVGSVFDTENPLSAGGDGDAAEAHPAGMAARSEAADVVFLALQFLDDEDRQMLVAYRVEGLSWAAIGERFGVDPDAARMRCKRLEPRLALHIAQIRSGRLAEA